MKQGGPGRVQAHTNIPVHGPALTLNIESFLQSAIPDIAWSVQNDCVFPVNIMIELCGMVCDGWFV